MNKSVMGAVIIVVAIAIIGFVAFGGDDEPETTSAQTTTQASNTASDMEVAVDSEQPATSESTPLTAAVVASHSTGTDCWTIVDGNVYDITSYVPVHPGGDEILQACGADGTTLFQARTTEGGEQVGSGTPHSSNASSQLEGFLLGALEN